MNIQKTSSLDKVIKGGYCIGCGACSSIENSPYRIKLDEHGCYVAGKSVEATDSIEQKCAKVCPFSEDSDNESVLSEHIFGGEQNEYLGFHLACFAGFVIEGQYRQKGSSGGVAKWLGAKLLELGEIDYFIQIKAQDIDDPKKPLFKYEVFSSYESVIEGSKSCYYPTNLSSVVDVIRKTPGKYAITGVPCFIKALRLLFKTDKVLNQRIKFTVGIICGGMKSANHAKLVGWQLGVHPNDLIGIDFRKKKVDRPANEKQYEVWSRKTHDSVYRDADGIFGTDYASGMFKPKACDFCDDVVGELADISIGDAWLEKYRHNPKGTSLIIVRNSTLLRILEESKSSDILHLDQITTEQAILSQAGGFRHRREGLSHRISLAKKRLEWVPPKRQDNLYSTISPKRQKIYEMRFGMAIRSHEAFLDALRNDDLDLFNKHMLPLWRKYRRFTSPSLLKRGLSWIKRFIRNYLV